MQIARITLSELQLDGIQASLSRKHTAPNFTNFGASEPTPQLPAPPVITEADVKQAEQEGYQRGFAEGQLAGEAAAQSEQAHITAALSNSLAMVSTQIETLISHYNHFISEQKILIPSLALAIAKKVAGNAIKEDAMATIEPIVTQCLESLMGESQVSVLVNNSLAAPLEEKLVARFAHCQQPVEINIAGDENFPLSDCKISWKRGNAERNTAQVWQQMEQLISDMIETAKREPAPIPSPFVPPQ